ncbi:unnamed protein product [Effrenium voratum]|nr:unnamed protein product [Effrenium voratum]
MALSVPVAPAAAPAPAAVLAFQRRSAPRRASSASVGILPGMTFLGGLAGAFGRRSNSTRLHAKAGWPQSSVSSNDPTQLLREVRWPEEWPYSEEDFRRQDETSDTGFYSQPRICTHVDDNFIATLTKHYEEVFAQYPNARILDLCSSWISHYPAEKTWSHVSITGMNEYELEQNKQADDYTVRDLNTDPKLPYDDQSFDIVTCTVSFDYLCRPLEVMKEVGRVLKVGGMVLLSTSNRCFPSKAVNIWLQTGDMEHVLIYGSYMHYAGCFDAPEALDLGGPLSRLGFADPVYVIRAKKSS